MPRLPKFGRWFRRFRCERGYYSAAELSRSAGQNRNYVSEMERGKARPKAETIARLGRAMKLNRRDLADLRRRANLEKVPAMLRTELDRAAIPDLMIWEHLPALVYRVDHNPLATWEAGFDALLGDLVPPMASLLAWLTLMKKAPTKQQRERLKNAARMAFDDSLAANRKPPQWTPADAPRVAAGIAASILPRTWRTELFAERRSAVRVVRLLKRWTYIPPSARFPDDRPRFGVQLADSRLAPIYEFTEIPPTLITNTHDAMIAHRLRHELDLRRELGLEAQSQQEWYLAFDIPTEPSDTRLERRGLRNISQAFSAAVEHAQQRPPPPGADDPLWAVVELRERAKFALRIFELPDLAGDALACTKDELLASLSAAADVLQNPPPLRP